MNVSFVPQYDMPLQMNDAADKWRTLLHHIAQINHPSSNAADKWTQHDATPRLNVMAVRIIDLFKEINIK